MKLTSLIFILFLVSKSFGQSTEGNKERSIFKDINKGKYTGSTFGYFEIVTNNNDTTILSFRSAPTTLDILAEAEEIYDHSSKLYTTSGDAILEYSTYAMANSLSLVFNENIYSISTIDGACDTPIRGLTFNYCPDGTTEYLTLFITQPIQITTARSIMTSKGLNYPEAKKISKSVTVLPGSTLILTIKK